MTSDRRPALGRARLASLGLVGFAQGPVGIFSSRDLHWITWFFTLVGFGVVAVPAIVGIVVCAARMKEARRAIGHVVAGCIAVLLTGIWLLFWAGFAGADPVMAGSRIVIVLPSFGSFAISVAWLWLAVAASLRAARRPRP